MDSQQLLDFIIKPTLIYMNGNYNSKDASMLLLATAAIESRCGYYISQVYGPAKGIWQMEPDTCADINTNSDALKNKEFMLDIHSLKSINKIINHLITSPMYACAMARLKYSMDKEKLPYHTDKEAIWKYYKRIYNTKYGAATKDKFYSSWDICNLNKVII